MQADYTDAVGDSSEGDLSPPSRSAGVPLAASVVYALVIAVPDQSIESVRAIEDFSILGSLLTWALWLLGSFMFVVALHETFLFVMGKDGQVLEDSALKEHTIPRRTVWEAGR